MDTIADMGGTDGWGPVPVPRPDEPVFAERWQARVYGLTRLIMFQVSGRNRDAFRHSLERLDRDTYLSNGYYGRWLAGGELMLTDSAILAPGAVAARARNLRGEDVAEPAVPEPNKPGYAETDPSWRRELDRPPAFAVGQRVRAKDISPEGHTRLPRYVRGHIGVVELIQPASVYPDTNAHFLGENPQHVYTVGFESRELWGADAEPFSVTIELYEPYLEAAA
jgi:nitrile hydratase subunit beta